MADIYLPSITSRTNTPIVIINKLCIGTETLSIYAGKYLQVDNVWCLESGRIEVACDATVANRYLMVWSYCGNQEFSYSDAFKSAAITASQSKVVSFNKLFGYSTGAPYADQYASLEDRAFLIAGEKERFVIQLDTGKAGDTFRAKLKFRWLNWDFGMACPLEKPKVGCF